MTVRDLRAKYLAFFESKGHLRFPAGSLIPYDVTGRLDESLLFNGAGMIQFKPYFRGVAQPENRRLMTCQPCVRTNDIEEVGDNTHLSFFEMLGNFSFGDYFKSQAIAFSWEFLTSPEWLGLDPKKLAFTVFEEDDEAFAEWEFWLRPAGINPHERVFRLGEDSNYWPAGAFSKGPPGPCGPNSEMFYWTSPEPPPTSPYTREDYIRDDAAGKWVEIWNDVFVSFEWQGHPDASGKGYVKDAMPSLPFQSIDTGMGLERTALVLGGYKSVYDTDVFQPIFASIDAVAPLDRSWVSPVRPEFEPDGGRLFFVCIRTNKSVPDERRTGWKKEQSEIETLGPNDGSREVRLHKLNDDVADYLALENDSTLGSRQIGDDIVREIRLLDGQAYDLYAWMVMPNHVKAVVRLRQGSTLDTVIEGWKTAAEPHSSTKENSLWFRGHHDRELRTSSDINRALDHIETRRLSANRAEEATRARRIIADHLRTASFCIADGVLPSNTGRGYVLRRLIRRAVLQGDRKLGIRGEFLPNVFSGLLEAMSEFYTDLFERQALIVETLRREEAAYRHVLESGVPLLEAEIRILEMGRKLALRLGRNGCNVVIYSGQPEGPARWPVEAALNSLQAQAGAEAVEAFHSALDGISLPQAYKLIQPYFPIISSKYSDEEFEAALQQLAPISGDVAFKLYGTFGFPLEATIDISNENRTTVDVSTFEKLLELDQLKSRSGQERESVYGGLDVDGEQAIADAPVATEFLGYTESSATGRIVRVRSGATTLIALDRTPFYAESGGQMGDHGTLMLVDGRQIQVVNTTKSSGTFWHEIAAGEIPPGQLLGETVTATVENGRRHRIQRNHTATHLLHAALRQVLGTHVTQAGSQVGPDALRFDFTHGQAMTEAERATVERIVNEQALANTPVVTYADLPIDEARAKGAMALFGEKYGNRVRMVEIGEFSRELCGGTHVRTTGEVGQFRIIAEASSQSGVRRIEAITGEAAYEMAIGDAQRIREAAERLKAAPRDLVIAVERAVEQLRDERKRREQAEKRAMEGGSSGSASEGGVLGVPPVGIGGLILAARNFGDVDSRLAAEAIDNAVQHHANLVAVGAVVADGKVTFIAKAGPEAVKGGAHVGNLLRELAKMTGGGGGGRPDFATAGGKDPSKVDAALAAAEGLLQSMVGASKE